MVFICDVYIYIYTNIDQYLGNQYWLIRFSFCKAILIVIGNTKTWKPAVGSSQAHTL